MKKRKFSSLLVFLGLLFIVSGIGLIGYNLWDDNRASSEAWYVFDQISDIIMQRTTEYDISSFDVNAYDEEDVLDPDRAMPTVTVDGYRYIGIVSIASLAMELPIMEEWDYTRMKLSPCRYKGSVYQNDFIICGHNYRSHFGRLDDLQMYDAVTITDAEGNIYHYEVVTIETLPGTSVEEMESGMWDLTLFTCTYSGTSRVTVRCRRVDE